MLSTRCSCDYKFMIKLNFRRFFRKDVKLFGTFSHPTSQSERSYSMVVTNLSMSGLRFEVSERVNIKKGDTLRVTFTLDNQLARVIDKDVIVRHLDQSKFGCEFVKLAYEEKDIGFYLFQS